MGSGTRNSPIAIDDSEDEVYNELYQSSAKPSPQTAPAILTEDRRMVTPPLLPLPLPMATFHQPFDSRIMHLDKKRKRACSFTSQDIVVAGSSNGQRQHPSLVNRLSQPESKKARKRRRRAERQALEEARSQNINWLNNTIPYASSPLPPTLLPPPLPSWGPMELVYAGFPPSHLHPREDLPYSDSHIEGQGLSYKYPYEILPQRTAYEKYNRRSSSPPLPPLLSTPSSDWVSSMALAADRPFSPRDQSASGEPAHWSPASVQAPPPPIPPPPMLPPTKALPKISDAPPAAPRVVEHHALPSKPPPPRSTSPIGMMPDLDPSSKHGTFHIRPSTKEAGSDMKKRSASYIPNPARTLVIEQLPKSHRHPDFINSWSRNACGSAPVHMFIDGPAAKAMIEFATAELARKAWASPRLGASYAGVKPHLLKGKVREDLIKVWWYRVDGVGAGAGVGEIEEGEIEGDASMEKEDDVLPRKETKKERKARLAKGREAKRLRQVELRMAQEQQQDWLAQQQQPELPSLSDVRPQIIDNGIAPTSSHASVPPFHPFYHNVPYPPTFDATPAVYTPSNISNSLSWNIPQSSQQCPPSTSTGNYVNKTAYGASLQNDQDESESIASSAGRSESPVPHMHSTLGHGDDLDDYEEVDMEVDELSPIPASDSVLPASHPIHSSLPARPTLEVVTQPQKPPTQKSPSHPPSATARVFVPRLQNPPLPAQNHLSTSQKPFFPVENASTKSTTNRPAASIIAPRPKLPSPTHPPLSESLLPPPTSVATAPPTSASSASSSSATSSSTPAPSEPKAKKTPPTEPSYTKRALMARQKELEEKIARSKMELAAATNKAALPAPVSASPLPIAQAKPSMDLGEKQAMEDRLRKLVLQSRKPAVHMDSPPTPTAQSVRPDRPTLTQNENSTVSKSASVSVSTHSFSLEDMAVSFITQTIETMKSRPASVGEAPQPPPAKFAPPSDVRLELAAKQRRLEEHISESKSLMTQLSQARTKSEKDGIMRIMREKTRQFEEASLARANSAAALDANKIHQSRTTTTTQQFRVTRWPVNCQDAGVLIVSDDEDEDED